MLQSIVGTLYDALSLNLNRYGFFIILAVYCCPLFVSLYSPSQSLQLQLEIRPFHIEVKYFATSREGEEG